MISCFASKEDDIAVEKADKSDLDLNSLFNGTLLNNGISVNELDGAEYELSYVSAGDLSSITMIDNTDMSVVDFIVM